MSERPDLDEGSPCPKVGCTGHLVLAKVHNCSCHIAGPCSSCMDSGYSCPVCGFDSTPDRDEPEYEPPAPPVVRDRSNEWTHTRTANPFNSTPFTACCGVAAIGTDRCPVCRALIARHDDGLDARRREVGPGNCLMCGKKRGPLGIPGNCCC